MNERQEGAGWSVDLDASLQSLLDDPACPALLSRTLRTGHAWQMRNETTVGRSLRTPQLVPQWTAALLALGAVVTVEGDEGSEEIGLEAVVRREIKGELTQLRIPHQDRVRWGAAHVARAPSDDPIVAALAVVRWGDGVVEDARLTLTGVSSEAVWIADASRLLVGQKLDRDRIEEVASAVVDQVEPQGDYLGSEAYRRAMAGVLTRRALSDCLEQEAGDD